jgi:hypothetical protein
LAQQSGTRYPNAAPNELGAAGAAMINAKDHDFGGSTQGGEGGFDKGVLY